MKVKVTEFNGALTVSVFGLGRHQELVICEDVGGFAFELRDREGSLLADTPILDQKALQEESAEAELFRKLAELRKEIANADGVPPYVVFHDKTLRAMVEKNPVDLQGLGNISGVGQSKLEKYGERFLAVINGAAA